MSATMRFTTFAIAALFDLTAVAPATSGDAASSALPPAA
jgi:hypothetical protein